MTGSHFFKRPRHKIFLLQTRRAACRPSRHLEPRHLTSRRQTIHPKTLSPPPDLPGASQLTPQQPPAHSGYQSSHRSPEGPSAAADTFSHLPLPRPLEGYRRARHDRITFHRHAWVPQQSEPADIGLAPADLTPVMVGLRLITAQTGAGAITRAASEGEQPTSADTRKYVRKANCPPPPPTSRRPQSLSAQETRYGADPSLGKF